MIKKNITISLEDNLSQRLDDLCNELEMSLDAVISKLASNFALNSSIDDSYIQYEFNEASIEAFKEAEEILKNGSGSGYKSMTEFREAMRS